MDSFDVIVVGLGAMGAATTYQLAKNGVNVLGIDRLDPPHAQGSSHGDTRITRLLYNYGPQIPLVRRSHEIWHELEAATGVSLKTDTGGLFIGDVAAADATWIEGLINEATSQNVDYEVLDATQLRRRFPMFKTTDRETGLYDPASGVLRPEECIRTQLQEAERHGANVHRNERVTFIEETAGGVVVTTNHGDYGAERVVVTAGPWTNEFLTGPLTTHVKTYRQVLYWFDIEMEGSNFLPGEFPIFVWQIDGSEHDMFYGFPSFDGPSGGLKVATDQYEVSSVFDDMNRTVSRDEIDAMFDTFVHKIDGLSRRVVRTAVCAYTVTSDWQYLIDWRPGSEKTLLVSACMGRGFKHSAGLGEAIAQLVTTGTSAIDLSEYRIGTRFP